MENSSTVKEGNAKAKAKAKAKNDTLTNTNTNTNSETCPAKLQSASSAQCNAASQCVLEGKKKNPFANGLSPTGFAKAPPVTCGIKRLRLVRGKKRKSPHAKGQAEPPSKLIKGNDEKPKPKPPPPLLEATSPPASAATPATPASATTLSARKQRKPQAKTGCVDVDGDEVMKEKENLSPDEETIQEMVHHMVQMDEKEYFLEPPAPQGTKKVRKQMSLGIMKQKLKDRKYISVKQDFMKDVMQLCRNVFKLFDRESEQYQLGTELKKYASQRVMTKIPRKKAGRPRKSTKKKQAEEKNGDIAVLASASASSLPGNGLRRSKRSNKASEPLLEDGIEERKSGYLRLAKKQPFEPITDYVFYCDEEALAKQLRTKKRPCCDGQHCGDLTKLGPFSFMDETWQSLCEDRRRRTECSDECKCDPTACRNRGISNGEEMILGKDVRTQNVYGIDKYTHVNLVKILPDEMVELLGGDKGVKDTWVEEHFLPALNAYEYAVQEALPQLATKRPPEDEGSVRAPFYCTDVMRLVLLRAEQSGEAVMAQATSFGLRVILTLGLQMAQSGGDFFSFSKAKQAVNFEENWPSEQFIELHNSEDPQASCEASICDEEFALYSKGTGVVCLREEGIKTNQFVVPFFGEVYPPWAWYEKSDRVRWLEKSKGAEKQMEFFNMMLERHLDDEDGFDVLFIDPSKKGNYASRISHSCRPNCLTVSMAVQGRFMIAVFAIRDIRCGEELSFDYHSVTENEEEWKHAVCLCGMRQCRNYYLDYAGTGSFTQVLKQENTFLHRTASLYLASSRVPLSDEERDLVRKCNLQGAVLEGIPDWMQKYCAQILKYVDLESRLLPESLAREMSKDDADTEAFGVRHNRLQNLVITLNKMKFYFRNGTNPRRATTPPLIIYSAAQVVDKLWYSSDGLIQTFLKAAAPFAPKGLLDRVRAMKPAKTEEGLETAKKYLIAIRDTLRKVAPTDAAFHHAAADCFDFYAHTKYWFSAALYDSFSSRVFTYKELGYSAAGRAPAKRYHAQYVWGQLNFWDRQTIEQPDASLSQMRRGTIALPNVECCYSKSAREGASLRRPYGFQQRKDLYRTLATRPHMYWPTKWHWQFRNGKIYGSPWLDAFIDPEERTNSTSLSRISDRHRFSLSAKLNPKSLIRV